MRYSSKFGLLLPCGEVLVRLNGMRYQQSVALLREQNASAVPRLQ
jgi:hypothetical protein